MDTLIQLRDKLKQELELEAFEDLESFIPWLTPEFDRPTHLSSLIKQLNEITFNGVKKNICISAPPQHGKTKTLQHWLALHLKLHPKANIVYMSYNVTQASKRAVEIHQYAEKLGIKPHKRIATKSEWWTTEGGVIKAAGEKGFTGDRADIIIIDDPHTSLDDVLSAPHMEQLIRTFEGVVETREKHFTSVIVTHTRWHKRDLIGWILDNRDYDYINIPVLNDGKPLNSKMETLESIDRKRKSNPQVFNAMYMGVPMDSIASLFQKEIHFKDNVTEYDSIAIGCDLAYTESSRSDYTAYVVMYKIGDKYHIEDAGRWQSDINITKIRLMELYQKYGVPIQLEDNGVQKGVNSLLSDYGIYISKNKISNSKYTRALDFASEFNLGNVTLKRAEWNEGFIKELLEFTGSNREHDDWVDASVMAFRGLRQMFSFA